MMPVVAIAMSGGVDSLVSAFLLKQKGCPLFGIHFITGFEPQEPDVLSASISRLSDQVGFPIHVVDFSHLFRTTVVEYFIKSYRKGTTPNPCLVCNPNIKFEALFSAARKLGADQIATGHYARVERDADGNFHLLKGKDRIKDQSYFLSFLSQRHLSRANFPLGDLTKSEVKRLATDNALSPISDSESQDVCFIREKHYVDFLSKYAGLDPEPGPIMTTGGETVGRHEGLHRFTIGQRRGINCPSSEPYYVVRIIPDSNTLIVGRREELDSESCTVGSPHWIVEKPALPLTLEVRLRYRHRATPATVANWQDGKLKVSFMSPQNAPTPGQGAVFYMKDEIVGAGIITS
jgi:tRNA-specific 2-thiouridylase